MIKKRLVTRAKIDRVFSEEINKLDDLYYDSYLWKDLTKDERDRFQKECIKRMELLMRVKRKITDGE